MTSPKSKRAGLLLTIPLLAGLTGCATGSPVQTDYCLIARPIHDSPRDTAETREQVLRHNSDWLCHCEDDCQ
jgi:hypothetical protein